MGSAVAGLLITLNFQRVNFFKSPFFFLHPELSILEYQVSKMYPVVKKSVFTPSPKTPKFEEVDKRDPEVILYKIHICHT